MKAHFSIIKYHPDTKREEGFGIGLILTDTNSAKNYVRFSRERVKRINSAFGIKKSLLVDMAIKDLEKKDFDFRYLDYLSRYENGTIRYTTPKIVKTPNLKQKFDELYEKFIADLKEKDGRDNLNLKRKDIRKAIKNSLKADEVIRSRLNIGYKFEDNLLTNLMFPGVEVDYIGGNGSLYCGEIINLDYEESTVQNHLYKTLTLFEAFDKTFSEINRFEPKDCKMIVSKEQAEEEENSDYMSKLENWHKKAGYGLLIQDSIEDLTHSIKKQVEEKNIIPFVEWSKKLKKNDRLSLS